jgi:hypothetical protein
MGPDVEGGSSLMAENVQQDHHHDWQTQSSHHTLDGLVRYQHCECGRWRINVDTEAASEIEATTHRTGSGSVDLGGMTT